MWLSTLLISLFFCLNVHASQQITAQIHDIDYGHLGEETLLLLTSGDVIRLNKHHDALMPQISQSFRDKSYLKFHFNDQNEMTHLSIVEKNKKNYRPTQNEEALLFLEPTILESLQSASYYFKKARNANKKSQCFNRAHIWSYEWFLNHSIVSNKTWLFFTRKYIREYKFNWWFHVAPSVLVKEEEGVKEKVMDMRFTSGPVNLKKWTDQFMKNSVHCPMVQNYSDYANYPESGWCYTMRSNMFYYQPFDLEMKDTWGTIKGNWHHEDIDQAYLEAFNKN